MKLRTMLIVCCLLWGLPAVSEALTAEEILLLKQNGVSEKTIQMMLQSEMLAQSQHDRTADRTMGVKTITRPDGRSAIVYTTGSENRDAHSAEERLKEERAWEMLRYIIVDARE